ncbi:aspartate/glutamate racemase family protein [Gluconobacter kanchanaburiensis]|uniref:aspartate/glutamate racemase family protein n=1 Tax=Gluconobacter kanchanaburiensis TaxID=563199 RepID=UPI0011BFA8C3|nr:aspartate/glutamate racemase family protein [Gluconobacter kanchanaburiensis]MBF0862443.1 Asp/Glu racemase [Gluconobacter kanchanaburiensis]
MTDTTRILVINPNSSDLVTAAIDRELEHFRGLSSVRIDVCGTPGAPPGVSYQRDADDIAPMVRRIVEENEADAYVIACFSDPGLAGVRETFPEKIILGCGENAILQALTEADQFGIISLSILSTYRQRRKIRMMGVAERYVGSQGIASNAVEATSPELLDRMVEAGQGLLARGADIILTGCASMSHFREPLEERLGVRVIDPVGSAVCAAIGRIILRQGQCRGSGR